MKLNSIDEIQANQIVLLREDFNVPLEQGQIRDSTRIDRALPTIKQILARGAKLCILSHLGRPKEGEFDPTFSLAPVADYLSQTLNLEVPLASNWLEGIEWPSSSVVLAENVRFLKGEKANDAQLAKTMATGFDVFVLDAFACAHRAQASTAGVSEFVAYTCPGPLLQSEIQALNSVLNNPKRPLIAIIGGAKVSTKIVLLEKLLTLVDGLIIGGGIANTFIKAAGFDIGQSLYEADYVDKARALLAQYPNKIPLPVDVVTSKTIDGRGQTQSLGSMSADDKIFDVGEKTIERYAVLLQQAEMILWNGPLGVFENPEFAHGTQALADIIAKSSAYTIVGGGDTIAAVNQFGVSDSINYISTGGGAFLTYLEEHSLPAIQALNKEHRNETAY